jgi:uncharacterized damage-inducible protein DinB
MSDQAARQFPDMWVDPEDDPRETDTMPVGEKAVLGEYLDRYRLTFRMKCDGLDAEQLARRAVPPSSMSLLGLVRHLAAVEQSWFRRALQQEYDLPRLWGKGERPDADFDDAVADEAMVSEAWSSWHEEVANARQVYADLDLEASVDVRGEACEARDIIVHLIEEYARHVGHADLLRECIDGRTGQ